MDRPDDLLVTASPYTKYVLSTFGKPAIRAISLEEALAENLPR
jgi:hypothetical protein